MCSRPQCRKISLFEDAVCYLLLASSITMLGWPGGDEQLQADHYHGNLYIDDAADPLMGLPVYPDHCHDQALYCSFMPQPVHHGTATDLVS
jgi:hypothetical protein